MKPLRTTVSILLIALSSAVSEESKVAIVDMGRILKLSRHLAHAETWTGQKHEISAQQLEQRKSRYKDLLHDYQAIHDEAASETDADERDRKLLRAEEIGQQARSIELQMAEYRSRRERASQPPEIRFKKLILDDIQSIVKAYADEEGFALVLDASTQNQTFGLGTPFISPKRKQDDITKVVLDRHNAATHIVSGIPQEEAPEQSNKITIYYHRTQIRAEDGSATNFSEITLKEGMTALDAIASEGGLTFQRHAVLMRGSQTFSVDLTGNQEHDLEPGDIIFIH